MGSSQSAAKDGGTNKETEQQVPAEERGYILARLVSQGSRLITPNPNPDSPETYTTDPAADTDNIAAQLQATEIAASVEAPLPADTPDRTVMTTPYASLDHGDVSVDHTHDGSHQSQDDKTTGANEQKKTKKKRKKAKAKNQAVTSNDVLIDRAPPQVVTEPEAQLHPPTNGLPTAQAQPQLTPIAEEDEETPAQDAGKPVEDDTATQDPSEAHQTSQQTQPKPSQEPTLPSTTDGVFRFDNFHPETRCREPECRKSTHPLDGSTKICPACGLRSKVRYCTKTCLYKDIRRHFLNECGRLSIAEDIDETTLDNANKPVRPYMRHGTEEMVNTVERHRQAVYFAMEGEGEYFIFDDVEECESDSPTTEAIQDVRGTGKCVYPVFVPDKTTREYFRRSLMNALTWGTSNEGSTKHCEVLAGMVILDLKAHGEWDQQMCTYLCMQMGFEFKYQIPAEQQV